MTATRDINNVGMTAFFIAHFRDAEGNRPDSMFSDPYSRYFVPDEVRPFAQRFAELCPEFETLIRFRLLVFRELVRREIAAGARQIVSVGAGFDTRPITFAMEGVSFFDVDQPAVIEHKRRVLKKHGIAPWPAIRCDYLDVNLPDRLADLGFDPDVPSLFIWEGNTMYLPKDLVFGFLNQLAGGVNTFNIGFDYVLGSVIDGTTGNAGLTRAFEYFYEQFTPFITGFDDPAVFQQRTPLRIVETGGMEDFGSMHAPHVAESLAPLKGLYNYCIMGQ